MGSLDQKSRMKKVDTATTQYQIKYHSSFPEDEAKKHPIINLPFQAWQIRAQTSCPSKR
jgi:hypothetical protein